MRAILKLGLNAESVVVVLICRVVSCISSGAGIVYFIQIMTAQSGSQNEILVHLNSFINT